jgi:hypothetical protein
MRSRAALENCNREFPELLSYCWNRGLTLRLLLATRQTAALRKDETLEVSWLCHDGRSS